MNELQWVQNDMDDEPRRHRLFMLDDQIFGLKFETWYRYTSGKGYISFTCFDNDQAIANVSVNLLDLIINGEAKKAIQLGTVMTHPDYRNRGLSNDLMNRVLEEYEGKCDEQQHRISSS